jgi:signal transduction histidine kinase
VVVQRQAVALASLRDDIMQAVKPGADGRKQEISLEIPESLPRVPIDVDMIRRVLINLTENAIKFTPSGGKIALTAESDGRQVRVTVVDNGPGIPTGERERIFEKFARIKSEGGPSGLGVGLAFCRLAVMAHGGRIWVESEPGQGSRFIFTLPVE